MKPETLPVNIEDEMRQSYLDYAMSVIVGRALPDVRDGLKPVHRRVLYAMWELGNTHDKPYKKSARIVGDVIGKYHPHGDSAVYDTIVRMAQTFSLRYPLVDGQGNFGSVDGDPAAAMRYTEVRMSKITKEMLADLEKDTVDFGPNYDDSTTEPLVMPSAFPNLLVNGSGGIAVGMATNIPPHNLGEICDAVIAVIKKPGVTNEDLIRIVPGPDFPTAGIINGRESIREAYTTGRGVLQIRAKVEFEQDKKTGTKQSIIVTELPYQVNKARLIEKIAELVRDKKIEGISDLRDESDRQGMRIVIELKRGEIPEYVLNHLYKQTPMQSSFGIIMLALVDGQPRVLTLKEVVEQFILHRKEIVIRRTHFDLNKAEARAHILEGLVKALDNLDEVIELIRSAKDAASAREGLMTRWGFSEVQAKSILEMQLQRLTGLERDKIVQEYKDVLALIEELRSILASEEKVLGIIVKELQDIKKQYGDERRTEIQDSGEEISMEDLIKREDCVVTFSNEGYVKRSPLALYRAQRRGGKGKQGATFKEEDFLTNLFVASSHDHVLFFSDRGKVYSIRVWEIPEAGRQSRGKPIINVIPLEPGEKITAMHAVSSFPEDHYLVFATRQGTIKKTELARFSNVRSSGIRAITLADGDLLRRVIMTNGTQEVFLGSSSGKVIRFPEEQARPMGRDASGVKGIDLDDNEEVIDAQPVIAGASVLTVSELGMGKRTDLDEYRGQKRGGKGILTMKQTEKTGRVIAVRQVVEGEELLLVTDKGQMIRTRTDEIRIIGRNTQGVRLFKIDDGERVVGVASILEKEVDGDEGDLAGDEEE